jgi:hypothetical protein
MVGSVSEYVQDRRWVTLISYVDGVRPNVYFYTGIFTVSSLT